MAHGLSGVKEQIDHYAAFFAAHGLACLVYDHRGFGGSEGEPRWELDPAQQVADWRDAITFALGQIEFAALPTVGVWGSSFAGGVAVVVAANDPRVGCVVAQIPHVSGHRNLRQTFNPTDRARLAAAMAADRIARSTGGQPATIAVFSTTEGQLCALPPVVSPRYVQAVQAATPSWSNEITLRSLENATQFEPAGWVPHISPTPMLMIVATNDACIAPELQLEVYATAREPKALVMHSGGHFDTYTEHFPVTSRAALDWLSAHLPPVPNADLPAPGHPAPSSTRPGHT